MKYSVFIHPPVLVADRFQIEAHASPYPYSFLKILNYFVQKSEKCIYIDMMQYPPQEIFNYNQLDNYIEAQCGNDNVNGKYKKLKLMGMGVEFLEKKLSQIRSEIRCFYITSTLTYNYPIIKDIITFIKRNYKNVPILLGGFYPTWMPEHAKKLNVDIHIGNFYEADEFFPLYSELGNSPPIGIFKLIDGCIYNCSFCCNKKANSIHIHDVDNVLKEIKYVNEKYGITYFENWDPNVMLKKDHLIKFLLAIKNKMPNISVGFEMGIQPNKIDDDFVNIFIKSNLHSITIPLESTSSNILRYIRKPYKAEEIINSLIKLKRAGFNFIKSHFTFMIGYPEDNIGGIIGCYIISILLGGIPQPFPVTVTPKTLDHVRYYKFIKNKDLYELNGNLFPLARSKEEVELKEKLLGIFNINDPQIVRNELNNISSKYKVIFEQEYEKYSKIFN